MMRDLIWAGGEGGGFGEHESDGAGDVGGGHGGAAEACVGAADVGGEDAASGCGDVDVDLAVVGVVGEFAAAVGGADGDDVREVEIGGVVVGDVVDVVGVVSGGGDEGLALGVGVGDRVEEGPGVAGAAPGIVGDFRAVVGGVADGGGDVGIVGGVALVVEDFHDHEGARQATPVTPVLLLPVAAMVPAVCVPCPSPSMGFRSLSAKSQPMMSSV
jgi:hypothetical protein